MRLATAYVARNEPELVGLAIALGADQVGGPLSEGELELVASVRPIDVDPAVIASARKAIHAGGDPLGEAFASIRSPEIRRKDGMFWTPPEIVRPMLDWALASGATRLVDPGSGSGRFSAEAFRRNPILEIVAIDLEPIAALMTRAALAVLGAQRATVLCADYLTVRLPTHQGKTAWVGNPPYVRHHDLDRATKAWAVAAAKQLGVRISGLAGLHALFFLATALHAKQGDVGCFVTSSEWLDVGYGSVVRELLRNGLGGRVLELVDPRAVPFSDAMTTALITCFEVGAGPAGMVVRMVAKPADLARLGEGRAVTFSELGARRRWSPFFRENGHAAGGQMLGSLFRVHRGVATGANGYFLMTKAEARARGLERWVRPAITSAAEILESDGVVHDSPERKVVLDLPADLDRAAEPAVDAYLASGEAAGIDQRYLCAHRRLWWRLGLGAPAPIVVSYMARQAPLFALNPDGLALINIGHGLYPRAPMSEHESADLVRELNGRRDQFAGAGRTYHGGLEKFEPREVESLSIATTR